MRSRSLVDAYVADPQASTARKRGAFGWASAATCAILMLAASCASGGSPPLANHVERSFDVLVVGDPTMREPVRAEVTSWLRHRGYVAAQIRRTPWPADAVAKLTRCLGGEMTAGTLGCLVEAGVHLMSACHLVIARVTRNPDTRALDLILVWLGDGAAALAPICRTPCADARWPALLTAELEHAAPLLEMGRSPRGAVE